MINQGKVYAIAGNCGNRKIMFLSLLAGLYVPTSGSIELEVGSTSESNLNEYRPVICQNSNLFQHLAVLENAAYPLYVCKMPCQKADALEREKLRLVGLNKIFSGGEQRMCQLLVRWHPAVR